MKQKILIMPQAMGRQYDEIVNLSFLLEYRGYRILETELRRRNWG